MRPSFNVPFFAMSILLGTVSIFSAMYVFEPFPTLLSTFAGASFGLAANIFIQGTASDEQTKIIQSITLDAEGVHPLPEDFLNLKWTAHATKKADEINGTKVEWKYQQLKKVGGSGSRFVTYSTKVKNLVGQLVTYHLTFIGSQGCVICVITRGHEKASTVIFDTSISAAGVHFAVAYLTDFRGKRVLTLMIAGEAEPPSKSVNLLSKESLAAFHEWYNAIDLDISSAYSTFPKK